MKKDDNLKDKKDLKEEKENSQENKKETKKGNGEKGKIKKFFIKIGQVLKKKWLIDGTKTLILVAIIIGIYIGANMVLENVVLPEYDTSPEKMYSISQETKDKLGKFDKEVTVTLVNYGTDSTLKDFVEKYKLVNNKIKIENIADLSSRADIMKEYSLDTSSSVIIVNSGDNEKVLTSSDLYTYDMTTYEQVDTTEEALTNAILNVTSEYHPKIYVMNSHIMYGLKNYSTILNALKSEANEVEELDILTKGEIPTDCKCLVITTLKEDLTELERDKIIEYIQNGGKMLLMCGPNITNVQLTNFQKVLDEYGVTVENGVIYEGDPSKMISGYPEFILENLTTSNALTNGLNSEMKVCLMDAAKLTFNQDKAEDLNVTWEEISSTSGSAFIRTNLEQQSATKTSSDGEAEAMTVAGIATKKIDDEKQSKLVIIGNELFAADVPLSVGTYQYTIVNLYNNKDFVLNSIAYLTENENSITIRKNYSSETYTVTEEQNTIILTIIFVVPVLIMVLGIGVWILRRKKR